MISSLRPLVTTILYASADRPPLGAPLAQWRALRRTPHLSQIDGNHPRDRGENIKEGQKREEVIQLGAGWSPLIPASAHSNSGLMPSSFIELPIVGIE